MAYATGTSFECKDCGRPVVWAKTDAGKTFLANPKDRYNGKNWLDPHTPAQCSHEAKALNERRAEFRKQDIAEQVQAHPEVAGALARMQKAWNAGDHDTAMVASQEYIDLTAKIKEQLTAAQEQASATAAAAPQEKAKGFTNKFPGKCVGCGNRVGTGEGLTSKGASGWEVRCVNCHHGGN